MIWHLARAMYNSNSLQRILDYTKIIEKNEGLRL